LSKIENESKKPTGAFPEAISILKQYSEEHNLPFPDWILSYPKMSNGDEQIGLSLTKGEIAILAETAKNQNKTLDQVLAEIVKEKIAEKKGPVTFEENSIVYERVTIDLPQSIADFYKFKAHVANKDGFFGILIAFDVVDNLRWQVEGITPESYKEMFNLGSAFSEMANKENRVLSS
jgi:hypothetical protein